MENNMLRKYWKDLILLSPRFMGTTAEKNTVEYLYNRIIDLELMPVLYPFRYEGWEVINHIELSVISPIVKSLTASTFLGSGSSSNVVGTIKYLGETIIWNMYNWHRFAIVNKEGEIIGYITGRKGGESLSQTLSSMSELPQFILGEKECQELLSLIKNNQKVIVSGKLKAKKTGVQIGNNISVSIPTKTSSPKVIICAHYDTMFNTPGAYDNTSGVAILLSLIPFLKDEKLRKSVELVFMGAEEWNLAGSKSYVNQLSEQERRNIELVINIDGIGRGDQLEAWVGPESIERKIFPFLDSYITGKDNKRLLFKTPPPPGSDHTPFFDVGIPVCMFTINDQEIIHSSKDVEDEDMYKNMIFTFKMLTKFLKDQRVIL